MSTPFDPASFVNLEMDTPLIKRPPLSVGDYIATIGEVKGVQWTKKDDPSMTGMKYNVPLTLEVPADQQDKLSATTIKLTDGIMLDLNEQGGLDMSPGRNGGLRRYREACDMNKPGDIFSAARMQGKLVKVKLTHELYQGEIQERISGVAKA